LQKDYAGMKMGFQLEPLALGMHAVHRMSMGGAGFNGLA
jgi:hypothetical protein